MAKKKKKKQQHQAKPEKQHKQSIPIKERLKATWVAKNPVLLFVLVFGVLMGLFYAFWITEFFKEHIFNPVLHINATIASFILNIFGYGTTVSGMDISNPDFTISVRRGCDAIEPTALFVSGVLAFPAAWKSKLPGIAVGIVFLLTVNMLRILSLFLTGLYAPSLFDLMHMEVWQVIFILLALICWVIWIQWAMKAKKQGLSD